MSLYFDTFATSLGSFSVALDSSGAVTATAFGDASALRGRLDSPTLIPDPARCAEARRQLLAYFAGEPRAFTLRLAPAGTDFQRRVWAALSAIPCGETRTYGQIAAQLGQPSASRAVGRANATNPICVIVPCHRVIGADGQLTGFAFGEEIKRRLLALEGVTAPPPRGQIEIRDSQP